MARQANTVPAPRTFKTAFCECFGCPAEAFQEALFRKCLDPQLRPVASAVRRLSPEFFRADLEHLLRVGETTDWLGLLALANHIRDDPGLNCGLLRKGLHLRISGVRLIKTYQEIGERRRSSLL